MTMETVSTNAVAVRRVHEGDRDYIVAPLSLIVPGVLNGSRGRLLYPRAEVASTARAWAGMPLVVYHPMRGGAHVSARDPEVLAAQGVGEVRSPRANGKLAAEGWFDVEKLRQVDSRVLARLERGDRVELSTGLFTDNDPVPGVHNGVAYDFIARNYRPDHVAVLPDEVGACSLRDGCGVNVNAQAHDALGRFAASEAAGDHAAKALSHSSVASGRKAAHDASQDAAVATDRARETDSDEHHAAAADLHQQAAVLHRGSSSGSRAEHDAAADAHTAAADMHIAAVSRKPAGLVSAGEAHGATERAVGATAAAGPVQDTRTARINLEHAQEASSRAVRTVDGAARSRAHRQAASNHELTASRHRQAAELAGANEQGDAHRRAAEAHAAAAAAHSRLVSNRAQLRHGDGKYGGHGDGTGSGPVHAAAAAGMLTEQDRELGRIAETEDPPSWARDAAKWKRAKRVAERAAGDLALAAYLYRRMGGMIVNFSSDEERAAAMVHMREAGGGKSRAAVRATRSAAQRKTSESHKQAARAHERAGAHHRAAGKKQLANEHSAMAKEHVKKAGTTVNREQTIEFLATNCSCWKGAGDRAVLETFSDDKLKQLRAAAERASQDSAVANAARKGAHGVKWDERKQALVSNKRDDEDEDEDEDDSDEDDSDEDDSDEDDSDVKNRRTRNQSADSWLKGAPKEVQSVVRNALAVERREKEQLIGRITANASSEELKKSAANRLASKPLDELRELAALLAPAAPEPSYFGAAAPFADAATVNREDILPLPGMDEDAS
jgi:hypothetical protein